MKKIIIILIIAVFPVLFKGCCDIVDTYQIIDCQLFLLDNSGTTPSITFDTVLNKKALGFQINTIDSLVDFGYDYDLGANSCYALSCEPGIEYINPISKIKITSLRNYSDQFGPNTEITELFTLKENYTDSSGFIPVEFIFRSPQQMFLFDTTALPTLQKFRFTFIHSNGLIVIKESPNLTLL